MVHTSQCLGVNITVDVNSGIVHMLDELTYHLLEQMQPPMGGHCPAELCAKLPQYDPAAMEETWRELRGLAAEGLFFEEDDYIDREKAASMRRQALVKAPCLHVSHDCNLRCKYCLASTGDSSTDHRVAMDFETVKRVVDFVITKLGHHRNIKVDFFGGEPLMAMDTVKKTVEYAHSIEEEYDKCFRFTTTTNGVLLNDESIEYISREMSNTVLFIGGRKEISDDLRPTVNGEGNYDVIVPEFQKLIKDRGVKDYYPWGIFIRFHQDFAEDVKTLASIGRNISVEPVAGKEDGPYALQEADLPTLRAKYKYPAGYLRNHPEISLSHFNVDLTQGLCVIKRLRGCETGCEYVAITPEGDIYPCHQSVGNEDYKLGSFHDGTFDQELSDCFAGPSIYIREECKGYWARFYCSSGCSVPNPSVDGNTKEPHRVSCELERKRLECVIALRTIAAGIAK